ncbi:unnamed protein product [Thlaspi arvense]|uniref:Ubiquitin-like protease family profile domain-containing protein n=1 Tax=Thlaspi arvense TaxID=13288 RepID=A0AAU9STS2_THLAR|nr:unnamed protein product [Thlaspi arvense]
MWGIYPHTMETRLLVMPTQLLPYTTAKNPVPRNFACTIIHFHSCLGNLPAHDADPISGDADSTASIHDCQESHPEGPIQPTNPHTNNCPNEPANDAAQLSTTQKGPTHPTHPLDITCQQSSATNHAHTHSNMSKQKPNAVIVEENSNDYTTSPINTQTENEVEHRSEYKPPPTKKIWRRLNKVNNDQDEPQQVSDSSPPPSPYQHQPRHFTQLGSVFDNSFLLQLSKPQQWTSTLHKEVLMKWLATREYGGHQDSAAYCPPELLGILLAKDRKFCMSRNKANFRWDDISHYVNAEGRTWVKDTDTVYVPMCWSASHWVGLAINLSLSHIEVLDPYPSLKGDLDVEKWLRPICDMPPYAVNSLCPAASQQNGLTSYTWHRVQDLYHNKCSGDCGPVAVKFMEMHAAGDPDPHMFGFTDEIIDQFRKQYALDLYRDLVIPLY